MKKGKYPIDTKLFDQLALMGFYTRKLSSWHYRITQGDDTECVMDVWPTVRKYCILENGRMCQARPYVNLIETVEIQLDIFNRMNR